MPLPPNINDREQQKFGLTASDKVAVRILGDINVDPADFVAALAQFLDEIGERVFLDGAGVSDKTTEIDLINENVGVGKTRYLRALEGSCSVDGVFTVYQNTDIIMTKRTGPGKPDISLKWDPSRPINSGDLVRVSFKADRITGSSVEAYLFASDL